VEDHERKPLSEILGSGNGWSVMGYGYRSGGWFLMYGAPFFAIGVSIVLLASQLTGGDSRGQSPGWAWTLTIALWAPFAAYWFGWRWGIHVRVGGDTLIWHAAYRRKSVDLQQVTVAAARYPWLGLCTLGLSDGSALTLWLGAPGWHEFLRALDRTQGTDNLQLQLNGIHRFANRMSVGWFGEGYYTN